MSLGNNSAAPVAPTNYNILYTLNNHVNPGTYVASTTYRINKLTPLIRY